jgi:hypothetical protein
VSGFVEDATTFASFSRKAMWPAPMSSGAVPKALLNTTRTRVPPILVRTIWRTV